jgi:hypothetical protein
MRNWGSVVLLKAELDRLGLVSKRRERASGRLADAFAARKFQDYSGDRGNYKYAAI